MTIVVIDWVGLSKNWFIPIASIAILLIPFRLFFFLRIFRQTATLARMISEIVKDMVMFMFVFFLAVIAFANSFYIIARNNTNTDPLKQLLPTENPFRALIYSYSTSLGTFETEGFDFDYEYLVYSIWFLCSFFTLILLLNLLISIMGNTFD